MEEVVHYQARNEFDEYYKVFPITLMHRQEYNYGGKILLPPSALHRMADEHFESNSPLLFRLTSTSRDGRERRTTHCGVLEFIADEGRMYIPEWMMKTLQCRGGDFVHIEHCQLPKGTFIKIQPQSVAFLDIWDPRAALENSLKMFSTLTKGDVVAIQVGETVYEIKVLEVEPDAEGSGICIHETDLNVDFAPPVGYVEPERQPAAVKNIGGFVHKLAVEQEQKSVAGPFAGQGRKISSSQPTSTSTRDAGSLGLPVGIKMPEGKLYIPQKGSGEDKKPSEKSASPFQGVARKLK